MDGCHWYSINLELMHIHHRTQKIIEHTLHTKRRQRRRAGARSEAQSYTTSKVRGSGLECQAATVQERPRGATPRPRSGAAAGRSHPTTEARGGTQGQGRQPEGATPRQRPGQRPRAATRCPRPVAAAWRGNPTLKVRKGGERRYPSSKVRSSSCALLEQP